MRDIAITERKEVDGYSLVQLIAVGGEISMADESPF